MLRKQTTIKNGAWIWARGPTTNWGLCWCPQTVFPPKAIWKSTFCVVAWGHIVVSWLCYSQRSCGCEWSVLSPEVMLMSEIWAASDGLVWVQGHVHDLCGLQKACGGAWSMHSLTVNSKVTFVVILMTADAQLRGRDTKGFCDNSHKYRYTDNTNWTFLLFFYFLFLFLLFRGVGGKHGRTKK